MLGSRKLKEVWRTESSNCSGTDTSSLAAQIWSSLYLSKFLICFAPLVKRHALFLLSQDLNLLFILILALVLPLVVEVSQVGKSHLGPDCSTHWTRILLWHSTAWFFLSLCRAQKNEAGKVDSGRGRPHRTLCKTSGIWIDSKFIVSGKGAKPAHSD